MQTQEYKIHLIISRISGVHSFLLIHPKIRGVTHGLHAPILQFNKILWRFCIFFSGILGGLLNNLKACHLIYYRHYVESLFPIGSCTHLSFLFTNNFIVGLDEKSCLTLLRLYSGYKENFTFNFCTCTPASQSSYIVHFNALILMSVFLISICTYSGIPSGHFDTRSRFLFSQRSICCLITLTLL